MESLSQVARAMTQILTDVADEAAVAAADLRHLATSAFAILTRTMRRQEC